MSTAASSISNSSAPSQATLTRRDLSSDLTALLSGPDALSSLSSDTRTNTTAPSTTAVPDQSSHSTASPANNASALLDAFAPSKATPEDSLGLARAYVRTMRRDVAELDDGSLDRLGERVDGVRERGTEVVEALGGVKV